MFLLVTISSANASTVIPVNIYKDDPGDPTPPNTAITAICNVNTITVQAIPTNGATSLPTNFDITSVYLPIPYNTGAHASAAGETWTYTDDHMPSLGGFFGSFPYVSEWQGENRIKSGGPIAIYSENIESQIRAISGYSIVVKVSWNGDQSNWVGGKAEIPEFPSMTLPIAAIMGIMLIFGRKRKE